MTLKRAKGRHYKIQDRAELSALIGEAVARDHDGSRNRAAKDSGLPHSTLKRYHDGRGPFVRHETLDKLRQLIGPVGLGRLEKAVLTPTATDALLAFDRWLREETRSTLVGTVRQAGLLFAGTSELDHQKAIYSAQDRAEQLEQLCGRWQKRYAHEFARLKKQLVARGHFKPRARLAFLRVLAPLLDSSDSAGIERSWSELTETERRMFVRAGVTREVILLRRENDVQRAQDTSRIRSALMAEYSLRPPWRRF
jgi:hypothetical protein